MGRAADERVGDASCLRAEHSAGRAACLRKAKPVCECACDLHRVHRADAVAPADFDCLLDLGGHSLLAPGNPVPDLVRGLLAFTLFFAAYVAEYVRSGLQSVPRGQIEAAASLGLSATQTSRDVVLPQALRVVTPALVGNVLDVFNTVPLLFIIGLTDFLRAGQMVLVDPQSNGRSYEIYLFMFAVYLVVSS